MESFCVYLESDKDDFFNHHYTGFISSKAYERTEAEGSMSWLKKEKYPILIDKKQFGQYEVEFRKTGERLQYVKTNSDNEIARDQNGMALNMTQEEIKTKNLAEFDQTIVAFIDDKAIGYVSNEWGAMGVWVELPYQKLGIGTELAYKYVHENPEFITGQNKIGQMTQKGIGMTKKLYDRIAKEKGENWFSKERV